MRNEIKHEIHSKFSGKLLALTQSNSTKPTATTFSFRLIGFLMNRMIISAWDMRAIRNDNNKNKEKTLNFKDWQESNKLNRKICTYVRTQPHTQHVSLNIQYKKKFIYFAKNLYLLKKKAKKEQNFILDISKLHTLNFIWFPHPLLLFFLIVKIKCNKIE